MKVILIAGTHAWRGDQTQDWFTFGSPFVRFLNARGLDVVFTPEGQSFIWSTDLGGIGFGKGDLVVWKAAGVSLLQFCVPPLCPEKRIPPDQLSIVAHSHGLQPVLFACAAGLCVRTLISVGSPVRKDLRAVVAQARPNIGHWLHIHSDHSDRWQLFGSLFDGHWGVQRQQAAADRNDSVPHVGHSQLLRDPDLFHHWVERGWVDVLNGVS